MPREVEVRITQSGITRVYRVWYLDDSPEKAEAVKFFWNLGECPWLFSKSNLPEFLHQLPIEEANKYLKQHPIPEEFKGLTSWDGEQIHDDDLARLQYFPELEIIRLHSDNITNVGVQYFRQLKKVRWFEFYSSQVTDDCLETLRQLRTVRQLDLQGCPKLSRPACEELVQELGVSQYWLPYDPA